MKHTSFLLLAGMLTCTLCSCSFIMNNPSEEKERVPRPPDGSTKSQLPWNKTQKFEGEAQLGPLASPRR
ncbi:MAG: hypothetical protein RR138_07615 [Akkermansia sp.]